MIVDIIVVAVFWEARIAFASGFLRTGILFIFSK